MIGTMKPPKKKPDAPDAALFRQAMADVRPLKKSHLRVTAPVSRKRTSRVPAKESLPLTVHIDDVTILNPEELLSFARSGIASKVMRELRGGKASISATLDLHGLTAIEAQHDLHRFLNQCLADGHQHIRIIHGKGRGTKDAPPILKSIVNHWLREQPEVLAFCSAPPREGGAGAALVLLKRSTRSRP